MRYIRTQIYLDPDDHRRLTREARDRGISLAALVREIVSRFGSGREPMDTRTYSPIIGVVDADPSDVASEQDRDRAQALEERLRRKLGEAPNP